MRRYILDKVLNVDTEYTAERDKLYVIRKVGTNSTTKATLKIANAPCLEIIQEIARIQQSHLERFSTLDLGDHFVVLTPDKKMSFSGASGSKMRIMGEILELAPGEAIPTNLLARYKEQPQKFMSYERGTYSHGTDTTWVADDENNVIDIDVPAGERWTLDSVYYGDIANLAAAHVPGDWSLRFLVRDKALDIISKEMGDPGIDLWGLDFIYDTVAYHALKSLAKMPITLEPGTNFKVKARNVSGANKSPATGTSITVTVTIAKKLEYV